MACNCHKAKKQKFVHTDPSGKKTTYTSQVEAQAAKIRRGGHVQPVSA